MVCQSIQFGPNRGFFFKIYNGVKGIDVLKSIEGAVFKFDFDISFKIVFFE